MAMYFNTNIFLLAFFAIIVILSSSNNVVGQDCQGDMQGLMSQCSSYVKKDGPKIKPSPQCCDVIKKADIPCVCKRLTAEIEKAINMDKVVFVANTCGKPLVPGSKCGAFNVPPAAYIG
ncbi:male-cone protein 1-like [Castanea sativa]|uniref:male-cone protein 1-like n=1 Tax=Castanea sativa TaxID=21020 RepID=UPI003F64F014